MVSGQVTLTQLGPSDFMQKLENTQLKKSPTILKVCFDLGKISNMQSIYKLEPVTGKLRIQFHSKLGNGCCTNF